MSSSTTFSRRQLAKGVAGSMAVGILPAEPASTFALAPSSPSSWVLVQPGVWRATLGVPEEHTPVRTRLIPARKTKAFSGQPPIPAPASSTNARGTEVELPLLAHEEIYGFGLQFFSLQQRAKKRVIRVNADPRADTGESHAPVPFYVSSNGYGVLVDTACYATFYCGNARTKPSTPISTPSGSGNVPTTTTDLYAKTLTDAQTSRVLVEVPNAKGVDVYLFAGPAMLDAVRRYNQFSGGGISPPEWGLGFWYRTQSNATDHDIDRLMGEFRERNIPCDVLGLEAGWQTHAYSCTFAWNPTRFPDPGGFVKRMQSHNLHVNLWEHAFTNPASPLFGSMSNLSGDQGVWGGLVPDFQDARARKVFGDYHGSALVDLGVDGFKLDECDNSDYTGGWSFPELSLFPSGVDGEQMHSLFGLRYQHALLEQYEQRKRATYCLVRSSGALAAPYPFVLYSDLYDHRQFVRALVNSGFSGLLWCPEVRDAKSQEDLIRRLQTVVFSPLAMINGWYIPNPPWKQLDRKKNNANELTAGWEELESVCREIIGWRMQIIPYLRAAFGRYAEDGTPPFRALVLDWPDHPELGKVDDAWMVGDRMLVAPLFAGEGGRKLLVPPGDWHNFWTGERISGSSTLSIPATEKNIPVLVKAGSVLPLAAVTNSTADAGSRTLNVMIFGDGSLPFELNTPEGLELKLTWDATLHRGAVQQRGPSPYRVDKWSHA